MTKTKTRSKSMPMPMPTPAMPGECPVHADLFFVLFEMLEPKKAPQKELAAAIRRTLLVCPLAELLARHLLPDLTEHD